MARDPVCGREVDPQRPAGITQYQGETYYFCSLEHKAAFDQQPQRYTGRAGAIG